MPVATESFRQVLGSFATGVTIVTLKNNDGVHGLTVNAFTSVSLEPPMILICIQKDGDSRTCMAGTDAFVVNILSADQKVLAQRFADSDLDSHERFENLSYRPSQGSIPILDDSLGYLECHIVNQFEGGDHTIFLAQVENAKINKHKSPLVFYRSTYYQL